MSAPTSRQPGGHRHSRPCNDGNGNCLRNEPRDVPWSVGHSALGGEDAEGPGRSDRGAGDGRGALSTRLGPPHHPEAAEPPNVASGEPRVHGGNAARKQRENGLACRLGEHRRPTRAAGGNAAQTQGRKTVASEWADAHLDGAAEHAR